MLKEEEQKIATKVLGIRIGELEANIKNIAGQHDTMLEWERLTNQKLDKDKEAAKATKTALEKKLKGEATTLAIIFVVIMSSNNLVPSCCC